MLLKTFEMSSRKQRLDVGSSSEPNKPQKRRFDDVAETDLFNKNTKSNETSNSNINRFTMQACSHQ